MFKNASVTLGLASLSSIRDNLNRLFGEFVWIDWELETISHELKLILDELSRDKISLLQIIYRHPNIFFTDIYFFLQAVEVINNKVADFDQLPMPTSLEIAYAIEEAEELGLETPVPTNIKNDVTDTISYILREEGYSEPIYPFGFIPFNLLEKGQTPEDTEAKKNAIEIYIKEMRNL